MKHQKHANLERRKNGQMGPAEIAFLGVKCAAIKDLVASIAKELHSDFKIAYADASHASELESPVFDEHTFHASGNFWQQGQYQQNPYTDRLLFSAYDLLMINGNHFEGARQVVILDAEKERSIEKRIDQISDLQFLIKKDEKAFIFPCLREKFPQIDSLPVYTLNDHKGIAKAIKERFQMFRPKIKGLVLAGGKSTRMGKDKGLLNYYGKAQRLYSVELLEKFNLETYLSVRKEQSVAHEKRIEDAFVGLGPFGAICSAFQQDPNSAWLVLATDLPYVDEKLVKRLLEARDPRKIATAAKGKKKRFPEPLVTIWEPKAYPILLQFLAQGYSCPRKVLINSEVKLLDTDDVYLYNVNTPEEFDEAQRKINA